MSEFVGMEQLQHHEVELAYLSGYANQTEISIIFIGGTACEYRSSYIRYSIQECTTLELSAFDLFTV